MASEKPTSLREQLVGAWELIRFSGYNTEDHSDRVFPMGEDVQGILTYTSNGYMGAQLQSPGQKPFQRNDPGGGTPEEFAEAGRRYLAYTGAFYLDESSEPPLVQHRVANSNFPNWMGGTQKRLVKLENKGEDVFLTLAPDEGVVINGTNRVLELVWRRLPDNYADHP